MKKIVKIKNIINMRTFQGTFIDDDQGMNEWIAKLEAKALKGIGWGHGPRSMSKADCIAKGLEVLIIAEYPKEIKEAYDLPVYELDGDGNPIMEEYTYTIPETGEEAVGERPKQAVDENGNPIFDHIDAVMEDWVDLKAEYEITITDVTTEYEAELQAKADRKAEIALLKQADTVIQGWNSLSDINLPFLKKFFRRILKEMAD